GWWITFFGNLDVKGKLRRVATCICRRCREKLIYRHATNRHCKRAVGSGQRRTNKRLALAIVATTAIVGSSLSDKDFNPAWFGNAGLRAGCSCYLTGRGCLQYRPVEFFIGTGVRILAIVL